MVSKVSFLAVFSDLLLLSQNIVTRDNVKY